MTFKKHSWLPFGGRGLMIEIILRDESNAKIDLLRFRKGDEKSLKNVKRILKEKYSISFGEEGKEEEEEEEEEEEKTEVDWLESEW